MSLKVWLPLDGSLRQLGVGNITTTINGATVNTAGKIGSCYSFDGSDDYISLTGSDLYNTIKGGSQPFSICFWAMHGDSTRGIIFGDYYLSGSINFNIEFTTDHLIRFYWAGDPDLKPAATAIDATTWAHIAITYDGTQLLIYKNSVLVYTRSGTLTEKIKTSGSYYLGRDSRTGSTALNGRLNDFRLYDECLSAAEVHEISQGLVAHYKLDSVVNNNLLQIAPKSIGQTSYNAYQLQLRQNLVEGETYTFQFWNVDVSHSEKDASALGISVYWGGGTVQLQHMRGTDYFTNGHADHLQFTITITNSQATGTGASNAWLNIYNSVPKVTGTMRMSIGAWKVERGAVATPWGPSNLESSLQIVDSSGYGHHGTIYDGTNVLPIAGSPRYNSALDFKSSLASINCGQSSFINSSLTYSFWAKTNAAQSEVYGLLSSIQSGGVGFKADGTNVYFSVYCNSNYTSVYSNKTLTELADNKWHLFTGVLNKNNDVRLYVDGVLQDDVKTVSGNLAYNTGTVLWIGAEAKGSTTVPTTGFIGQMSDVRIYCTALTADDVLQLYHTGAKVDNKQNLHTFEIKETNKNLLAGKVWTSSYSNHNPANAFTNFNTEGQPQYTANSTSSGTEYIPISPTGHTYIYDYTISVNAGNQFYIGFERYDASKTARSNNACIYTFASKPSSNIVKMHYTGTVDLSTDGVNPCAFIALRILNGWSGTTSGVTGNATIHNISLREIDTIKSQKLNTLGQFIEEEIKEQDNMKIYKNGIIEVNKIIEL